MSNNFPLNQAAAAAAVAAATNTTPINPYRFVFDWEIFLKSFKLLRKV